jgi:acetyltransferase
VTVRNLEYLFRPKSIALIGASERPGSVGATVLRNLCDGRFHGPVYAVNPKGGRIGGLEACRDVASLPETPELAVVATPPRSVPEVIGALAARGTRAAVVLTAGLSHAQAPDGCSLTQAMLDAARGATLRILGPNCVGLLNPVIGMNASFAHTDALPGTLAFVSQSGALTTAVLDWAKTRGIGFSHFVSLGESADVDLGDVLDYLASDPGTHAILLYIEGVTSVRKFMSAARAAARNKPVLAVKAGRAADGARAASSHTGALAGGDDVYESALRRAGVLRVDTVTELFDAVETLGRARSVRGDRLAIVTNGGGLGVMATDSLTRGGGRLAGLSPETLARLDHVLPDTWPRSNPVDIIGDAPVERYVAALEALCAEPQADAVLFMHAPTAIVPAVDIARACAPVVAERPVLSCWLGGDGLADARSVFRRAGIPSYATPEDAVEGFLQLVRYRRSQDALMETPPSIPVEFSPDRERAQRVVARALGERRSMLSEPEAKEVLAAYGIPVVATRTAPSAEEAVRVAEELGFPVALKIVSPQVTHKSDVGGVALDLTTASEVHAAAQAMQQRLADLAPDAKLLGFTVQTMERRPKAYECIAGATVDPVFGPVLLFGQGGVAVEVLADRAVALPPLNLALASDLVSRTRIARLLDGFRDRPPVDRRALHLALVQLSQLITDLAEVVELDINPLLVDERGVIALDARMRVEPAVAPGAARLAIRPYPRELEEEVKLYSGLCAQLRPIRPEDDAAHEELFHRLAPADVRFRFFNQVRQFPKSQRARFTQIDYDREMAFAAMRDREMLGVARAICDPNGDRAEFAILVRSDLKGQGLGYALLEKLVRYCRERGVGEVVGHVLPDNKRMLELAESLGFRRRLLMADGVVEVRLALERSGPTTGATGSAAA